MTPLAARLAARIRAAGPIGVDAYVAAALLDPEHGYYQTRDPFGADADFITAPDISQVFGELIGAWCAVVWQQLGAPAGVHLVELGPGRGTLLADALRVIARTAPGFAGALQPVLIEASRRLRVVQAATLTPVWCGAAPVWLDGLHDLAEAPAIIVANEFFDALPIRQFVRTDDGWRQRDIGLSETGDRFVFVAGAPVASPLPENVEAAAEVGAIVERCPAGEDLAASIGARLAGTPGAALILDYGYLHLHPGETLQALRRHRFAEVLDRPGECDLSHHVDFGSLAAAARTAGAAVFGPLPQGLFLGRIGIAERAEALIAADPERERTISGAVRRLVHPGRMGMLFKAMAIVPPRLSPPPGFLVETQSGKARQAP